MSFFSRYRRFDPSPIQYHGNARECRRVTCRPQLEVLEDRLAPATAGTDAVTLVSLTGAILGVGLLLIFACQVLLIWIDSQSKEK